MNLLDRIVGKGAPATMYVVGAYGRQACMKDWQDGKDFRIWNGPYLSVRDLPRIRQNGYEKILFMTQKDGDVHIAFEIRL